MKKLLTYFIFVATSISYGQQDLTLYYMENVPQRTNLNPAFKPNSKVNIGFPMISSIYFDHINTTFTPKNLFETSNGSTTLTIDNFKTKIKKNNYFGATLRLDILSFGIQVDNNYFSFNVTENIFGRMNFSKGFLELPLHGNADFDHHNGQIDMSNTGVNFSHYREFGFGWQREFSDKLSLGAKVKLLAGKSNVWTKKNTFNLQTNPDNFDLTVSGELDVRTSGFDSSSFITNGRTGEYFFNSANKGIAIDVGGSYQINEKINVNASLLDFGFIRWKSNNFNAKTNDASFSFTGIDLTEIVYAPDSVSGDSIDAAFRRLRDAAEDEFGYTEDQDAYTKTLMSRIHLGGTYQVYTGNNSGGKVGVLLQTEIYNKSFRPSLTLSYNQSVGRWMEAALSYSMINRGYNNLGLGLSLNLGPLQVYAAMDNVFAARLTTFQRNDNNQQVTVFSYPTNSHKTHVHFGINFTFGRKKKSNSVEDVIEETE